MAANQWSRAGSESYFYKVHVVSVFCFVSRVVSVTLTQSCHYSEKAAVDNVQMKGCACVSIKLYS